MTLGEYPYIRYHIPNSNMPSASLPRSLASKVQASLDNLARKDSSFPPRDLVERGVLLIVERGVDVVSPLLHEFTYQALVADVLGVESRYKTDEGQDIILDESDVIWVCYLEKSTNRGTIDTSILPK